jgi:outer membrane protein
MRALFFSLLLVPTLLPAQVVRVATVIDGPSPRLEETRALYETEIRDLLEPEFTVVFPERLQRTADWTVVGVYEQLDELLEDPEADVVIPIGLLASSAAAQEPDLPKPVIASPMLPEAVPTGAIPNLSYIETQTHIDRDLETFRELVGFENLAIVVDEELITQLPITVEELQANGALVVMANPTAGATLDRIPHWIDAVYVTPLYRMSDEEFAKLAEGLKRRRLPSFSLIGEDEVAKGLMLGLSPSSDWPRHGRRVALNLQRILLGELPEDLPVKMEREERLSFNEGTGVAVGYSPTWKMLGNAQVYGEAVHLSRLSLRGALDCALCINPEILAADQRVRAQRGEVGVARSRLLPQIDVGGIGRIIDKDRAREGLGRSPERLVAGDLAVRQVIWSDKVRAEHQIQKYLLCGEIADRHTVKLDILFEVGAAYINLLRFKTLLKIEQANLTLTQRNLQLAVSRVEIGTARRNEVYRWEAQVASNRERVVRARADVRIAEADLNRLLHRPALCRFATEERDLGSLLQTIGQKQITSYLQTPLTFDWFTEFEILQGWKCSPELRNLDASIRAQYRKVVRDRRAFWQPDFSFFGDGEQRVVRGGAGVNPPQNPLFESFLGSSAAVTDWAIGIRASFPLFQGGRKCAQLYKDRSLLRELMDEWKRTTDTISFRVKESLDLSLASFLSIDLAADAALSAQGNLDFVGDAYAQGVASILDLLDAQDTLLVSERAEANAQYSFALDLFRLMRAVGRFDFFLSENQRQAWFKQLDQFFACKEMR